MNCLSVGDILVPAKYFEEEMKGKKYITGFDSYSFLPDVDRDTWRSLIRKMETVGSTYYECPQEVLEKAKNAEIIAVHVFPVSRTLIEAAPNLKYILTCRGGLENIDVAAAKEHGVQIINCAAHNAIAVAEYTIGLMLAEMRNITRATRYLYGGTWREKYPNSAAIPELRTSTVGIVGFGTIGRLVADRLKAFGTKVVVSDPFVPAEDCEKAGVTKVELDELLKMSDVVTLHGRIAANDPPIIGARELALMKPTAYLINTARAVLVDTNALADALKNEKIMGAAIDVFPSEPLPEGFVLCNLDNCTLTNHRGGDTINSYIKAPELIYQSLCELIETGKTRALVR